MIWGERSGGAHKGWVQTFQIINTKKSLAELKWAIKMMQLQFFFSNFFVLVYILAYHGCSVTTDYYRNANIHSKIPRKSFDLPCKTLSRTILTAYIHRVPWNELLCGRVCCKPFFFLIWIFSSSKWDYEIISSLSANAIFLQPSQ